MTNRCHRRRHLPLATRREPLGEAHYRRSGHSLRARRAAAKIRRAQCATRTGCCGSPSVGAVDRDRVAGDALTRSARVPSQGARARHSTRGENDRAIAPTTAVADGRG